MKKYRAVVLGAGKIGVLWGMDSGRPQPASHAAAFAANSRTELVGIVDSDPAQREKAGDFYKISVYEDARECIVATKPDIIAIATPPSTHESLLALAFELGISAVICEKPVSDSLESAHRMMIASRKTDAIVIVNHQRRFFPLFQDLRARIEAGELGRIQQVTAYYGNGLLNNGSHTVDALQFLLDDTVEWAIGIENKLNVAAPFGTNIDGLLGFTKGTTVAIQSLDNDSWGAHDFVIMGTTSAAIIRQYGFRLELVPVKEGVTFADMRELDWANAKTTLDQRSMLTGTVDHLVECLDGTAVPRSTLEDGYRTMKVINALIQSAAESGKMIRVEYSN